MLKLTQCAPRMAIMRLRRVFVKYRPLAPSDLRSKHIDEHFAVTNDQLKVDGARLRLSKLGAHARGAAL